MVQHVWSCVVEVMQAAAGLVSVAVKGSAVLLVAFVAAGLLRRRSAALRHAIWLLAIFSLPVIQLLSMVVPTWHGLPQLVSLPTAEPTQIEVAEVIEAPLPTRVAPIEADLPVMLAEATIPTSPAPLTVSKIDVAGASRPLSARAALTDDGAQRTRGWSEWIALGWVLGACLCLIPVPLSLLKLRRLERRSVAELGPQWRELAVDCAQKVGLRRHVQLLLCSECSMPMTWGWRSPRILLPASANDWQEGRMRVVLMHELAHVKRFDCATYVAARVVCAIYWFNPLLWLALSRVSAERERACDDFVLRCGAAAPDYADVLLDVASACGRVVHSPCAATMARKSRLEGRLVAILDPRTNRRALSRWVVGPLLVCAVTVMVPLAALSSVPEKTTPKEGVAEAETPSTQYKPKLVEHPAAPHRTLAAPAPRSAPEGSIAPRDNLTIRILDDSHVAIEGRPLTLDKMAKTLTAKGGKLGIIELRIVGSVRWSQIAKVLQSVPPNVDWRLTSESDPDATIMWLIDDEHVYLDGVRLTLDELSRTNTAALVSAKEIRIQLGPRTSDATRQKVTDILRQRISDSRPRVVIENRGWLSEVHALREPGSSVTTPPTSGRRPADVDTSPVLEIRILDDSHVMIEGQRMTLDEMSKKMSVVGKSYGHARVAVGRDQSYATVKQVLEITQRSIPKVSLMTLPLGGTVALPVQAPTPVSVYEPGVALSSPPNLPAWITPVTKEQSLIAPPEVPSDASISVQSVRIVVLPGGKIATSAGTITEGELTNWLFEHIATKFAIKINTQEESQKLLAEVPDELYEQALKQDAELSELQKHWSDLQNSHAASTLSGRDKAAQLQKEIDFRRRLIRRRLTIARSGIPAARPPVVLVAGKDVPAADVWQIIDVLEANDFSRSTVIRNPNPSSELVPLPDVDIRLTPQTVIATDLSDVQLRARIVNQGRPFMVPPSSDAKFELLVDGVTYTIAGSDGATQNATLGAQAFVFLLELDAKYVDQDGKPLQLKPGVHEVRLALVSRSLLRRNPGQMGISNPVKINLVPR